MLEINIKTNIKAVIRQLGKLDKSIIDKATVTALNKTGTKAKTEMARAITSEFNIKQKKVRPFLSLKKSRKGMLVARLDPFKSKRFRSLNIVEFISGKPENFLPGRRTATGRLAKRKKPFFKVSKGGAKKSLAGVYIARGKNSGKLLAFRKKTGGGVEGVSTIGVPSMFNTKRIQARVIRRIKKEFPIEFERAVRLHLKRFNKK